MTSSDSNVKVEDFTGRLSIHPDAAEPVSYLRVTTSVYATPTVRQRTGQYKVTELRHRKPSDALTSAFKVEAWTDTGWAEVLTVHPEDQSDQSDPAHAAAAQVHLFLHPFQPAR